MKRAFDLFIALLCVLFTLPLFLFICVIIKLTSKGEVLYWSDRVGKNNEIFKMPKFRTMKINTPIVATHLLKNPSSHLTPVGNFLRKNSLDELPQIWSILVGDMSFVGPRPALFNQEDIINLRTSCGIHELVPGLTGWAQINGRDEISNYEKVYLDKYYLENKNILLDIKILKITKLQKKSFLMLKKK